jgi:hypothetical protein
MKAFWSTLVHTKPTKEQAKDTGMALVLILLIVWFVSKREGYLMVAMAAHVLNMIAPQIYRPAAVVWFGLSHVLGSVMSRVVLGLIFFLVVTPVGLVRKAMGADAMRLKIFKAGRGSVMRARNHTYTGKDIEQPY